MMMESRLLDVLLLVLEVMIIRSWFVKGKRSLLLLTCFYPNEGENLLERSAHAAREMFAFNDNETMLWLPHAHNKAASSVASFTGTNIQEKACNIGKPKANVDVKVKMGRRRKRKPAYHSWLLWHDRWLIHFAYMFSKYQNIPFSKHKGYCIITWNTRWIQYSAQQDVQFREEVNDGGCYK